MEPHLVAGHRRAFLLPATPAVAAAPATGPCRNGSVQSARHLHSRVGSHRARAPLPRRHVGSPSPVPTFHCNPPENRLALLGRLAELRLSLSAFAARKATSRPPPARDAPGRTPAR